MELFEYICHMEIKPKLYKLIKRFITQSTKGSDVFIHNGSKWIIFVEDKKWVIELTKEGTLWYNYYFFHTYPTGLFKKNLVPAQMGFVEQLLDLFSIYLF